MGASARDAQYRRAGGLCWVGPAHRLLAWAGLVEHQYARPKGPNRVPSCGNSWHEPSLVVTYDPSTREWGRFRTGGEVPPPTAGASGAGDSCQLLVWGGATRMEELGYWLTITSHQLYRLQLDTRTWSRLGPAGRPPPPAEKGVAWRHGDWLYLFGGYCAERWAGDGAGYDVEQDPETGGWWHNALVRYSEAQNRWDWPAVLGISPSPRAGAAATRAPGPAALLFGGRCRRRRLNDLHRLDLISLAWTELEAGTEPEPLAPPCPALPAPRSLSCLVTLPGHGQTAALYGGLDQLSSPLNDCWLLHCSETGRHRWEEVELRYDHGEVRAWHGAAASPVTGELILLSGLTQERCHLLSPVFINTRILLLYNSFLEINSH